MTYDQALQELARLLGISRSEIEPPLRAFVLKMPLREEDLPGFRGATVLDQLAAPLSAPRVSAHQFKDLARRHYEPPAPRPAPVPVELPPSGPRATRGAATAVDLLFPGLPEVDPT